MGVFDDYFKNQETLFEDATRIITQKTVIIPGLASSVLTTETLKDEHGKKHGRSTTLNSDGDVTVTEYYNHGHLYYMGAKNTEFFFARPLDDPNSEHGDLFDPYVAKSFAHPNAENRFKTVSLYMINVLGFDEDQNQRPALPKIIDKEPLEKALNLMMYAGFGMAFHALAHGKLRPKKVAEIKKKLG